MARMHIMAGAGEKLDLPASARFPYLTWATC